MYSAFNKLFGENDVYIENDGIYTFNKENFQNSCITSDATLSNKQFAGLLNTFIQNYLQELEIEGNVNLRQVVFSNLLEEENQIQIDIKYTFEIQLYEISSDDFLTSLFSKLVPKKILLTSTVQLTIPKDNLFSYSISNKNFKINNLSKAETEEVLSALESLKIFSPKNNIIGTIDNMFVSSILGGETTDGLINSINGSNGYEFLEDNGEIFIKIKKV